MLTFLLGSKVDVEFTQKMVDMAKEFGVDSEIIVASAHKVPDKVVKEVEKINARKEPTVVIAVVGMSNGLGGVVAGTCLCPVINCPPFKDHDDYMVNVHSSLQLPSDVPAMTVVNPKNAVLAALKILALNDSDLRAKLEGRMKKIRAEY